MYVTGTRIAHTDIAIARLHAVLDDTLRSLAPTVPLVGKGADALSEREVDYLQRLGEVIVETRVLLGMSQSELADAVGRSAAALSRWETGKVSPAAVDLRKIADVLGIPAEWLIYPPGERITRGMLAMGRAAQEVQARPSNRLKPASRRLRPRRRPPETGTPR